PHDRWPTGREIQRPARGHTRRRLRPLSAAVRHLAALLPAGARLPSLRATRLLGRVHLSRSLRPAGRGPQAPEVRGGAVPTPPGANSCGAVSREDSFHRDRSSAHISLTLLNSGIRSASRSASSSAARSLVIGAGSHSPGSSGATKWAVPSRCGASL